ncbi:MAG TPA: Type 1 glutamine amidotransferase-like domain-containing protein [Rhodoglobus sp.]|nr:Type 1 glutamine amidotransferase-like domain-containing protein [Rhodoglobus sp.]
MSIHLVGGGRTDGYPGDIYRPFIEECRARGAAVGRAVPRVRVVLVGEPADAPALVEAWDGQLRRAAECEPVITWVDEGTELASAELSDVDGLLVGGGLTPAYLEAVRPRIDEIRLLVADGLPYLGFSAGAAIAADTAVVGGWRIDGIPVCAEETGEDLDEVTVVEGLGLVDLAVDVHAAQWGTLSRLIAATEAGLVDGGVAIDEFTVLVVGEGALRVEGRGSVWRVSSHDDGVLVGTLGP